MATAGCSLLLRRSCPCISSMLQCRSYALSRFPQRTTGFGRNHRSNMLRGRQLDPPSENPPWTSSSYGEKPFADKSQSFKQSVQYTIDDGGGLKRLLLDKDELVVTRQLEMLNVFAGFEQSNRYSISSLDGEPLGYIIEEPRGLFSMFARQVFRTHRSFRALVMDLEGSPILWIRRPFSWINSRMYVQRPNSESHATWSSDGEPVLVTFAEVQQEWHLWRRRYNLFLRTTPRRVLTTLDANPQPELSTPESHFNQFARVDEGLLAWYFILRDAQGHGIASVHRAFRGFGREIFTDTGRYNISFQAPGEKVYSSSQPGQVLHEPGVTRNLSIDERALVLAMAINVDYDYFSRHSEGGHGLGFWWHSGE